jgi:DNA-binding transcriptional regulator LsrR (DeoR family)
VEITIRYPLLRDSDLERRLKDKYHLDAAFVINSDWTSYSNAQQLVGRMGAWYLEQILRDNITVGIGWGIAVSEVVKNLPNIPLTDVRVVQVLGAVGGHSDPAVDGPRVAANFAGKLNAKYHILYSPLFLDTEDACKTLKAQSQIAQTLDEGTHSDIVVLGIGTVEVDPQFSSICRSGFLTEEEIRSVMRQGGVGNFCGLILDKNGSVMKNSISARTMAVDIEELRKQCGQIVGVAAGEKKSKAIKSVLNGNWLDVLITDSAAVNSILQ